MVHWGSVSRSALCIQYRYWSHIEIRLTRLAHYWGYGIFNYGDNTVCHDYSKSLPTFSDRKFWAWHLLSHPSLRLLTCLEYGSLFTSNLSSTVSGCEAHWYWKYVTNCRQFLKYPHMMHVMPRIRKASAWSKSKPENISGLTRSIGNYPIRCDPCTVILRVSLF